jgi:hypothetical protein
MFPRKIVEEPILLDTVREQIGILATNQTRQRTGAPSDRSPASSFWSAIRSNQSIDSGAPMWRSTNCWWHRYK